MKHRSGNLRIAGCVQGLFSSTTKSTGGTAAEGFWERPAPAGRYFEQSDKQPWGHARTEVLQAVCGWGHLGHVF